MNKLEIIENLIEEIRNLEFENDNALDAIKSKGKMIIRNLHGEKSNYLDELEQIEFYSFSEALKDRQDDWKSGQGKLKNLFKTMREEFVLFSKTKKTSPERAIDVEKSNLIFVVHGHDETMKQSVARVLEKIGLEPIILHEKPNLGRTVIEKFTDYSDVGFAIVLLTPDDIGYAVHTGQKSEKYRARQNVILELGYFLGTLGRNSVVALHTEEEKFEIPSDYSGVLFVPFDSKGRWQFDLLKELKACGYDVDANKLL